MHLSPRFSRLAILLTAAVLASVSLGACSVRIGSSSQISSALAANDPAVLQLSPDPERYHSEEFDWRDEARQRPVPARLYFPAQVEAGAKVPLVVFSHGLGGSREGYKYLGRYFAANGYASLHVQHVGSDRQIWRGSTLGLLGRLSDAAKDEEAIARARDASFALDRLLESGYGARIDASRIVAAGHSYGANTAMLLSGAQVRREGREVQLRDARIRAAILLSAPPFYGDDPAPILGGVEIPTLHITAMADDIEIPGYRSGVADRLDIYRAIGEQRGARKALAVFKDGSHSIFTDRLNTGGAEWNPQVKLATRDLALAFLHQALRDDGEALDRWRQRYAGMLSRFEAGGRRM